LVEAAFSRLVIATFAVPDAASALVRLRAMGIEASLLASVLVGTINQRLLRQICSHCRVPEILTGSDRFGLSADGRTTELYKARVVPLDMRQVMAREERLCSHCGGAGYRGRLGCYEVMEIDKTLSAFIGRDMPSDQLHAAAVRTGMKTLLASSLELVKQGSTTLQEIERSILPPVQR
ncbi:MAG: type II/IV secretion system protein, partial [Coleofasciculaceae cyanobacterium SM2_3_26]|nr:type II/IV secretion system protein [Coleofasciculaceae cyanobacterium SM2_3_26]